VSSRQKYGQGPPRSRGDIKTGCYRERKKAKFTGAWTIVRVMDLGIMNKNGIGNQKKHFYNVLTNLALLNPGTPKRHLRMQCGESNLVKGDP